MFTIIKGPFRLWKKEVLHDIKPTFIKMHNMFIEDELDTNAVIRDTKAVSVLQVEMAVYENIMEIIIMNNHVFIYM